MYLKLIRVKDLCGNQRVSNAVHITEPEKKSACIKQRWNSASSYQDQCAGAYQAKEYLNAAPQSDIEVILAPIIVS